MAAKWSDLGLVVDLELPYETVLPDSTRGRLACLRGFLDLLDGDRCRFVRGGEADQFQRGRISDKPGQRASSDHPSNCARPSGYGQFFGAITAAC
jgi:hypothetical protein